MRWVALGVDYEMAGKDLIDSVIQSGKIARVLGGRPPEGFNYEMFLDEKGEKISKSKGNGLSLEEWLTYGSEESLAFYIYREPARPRACTSASSRARSTNIGSSAAITPTQPIEQKLGNPVHHIHAGKVPDGSAAADLWPAAQPRQPARLRRQGHRLAVRPALCAGHVAGDASRARQADRPGGQLCPRFRRADAEAPRAERRSRSRRCATSTPSLRSSAGRRRRRTRSRHVVFEVGKRHPFESLRHWFQALYETLLGSQPGPAHGQLHRALRHRQQPPADRRGARSAQPSARLRLIAVI